MLIVATSLSNHPNDKQEAEPTLDTLPAELGQPEAVAMDNGYFSANNIETTEKRGIQPYIATGREPHYKSVQDLFGNLPDQPALDASPKDKMAYKLATDIGKEIYRLRKSTVEPVIGIIKETLGFRQFSLRGLKNVAAEWCLVCLAFNLKRIHSIWLANELYSRACFSEFNQIYLKNLLLRLLSQLFSNFSRPFLCPTKHFYALSDNLLVL
jgi:hypothetical protein